MENQMITRLGEVEEDSTPKRKPKVVRGMYTAKVIRPGGRFGQVVEVVERRSAGDVVCVFEGNRFVFPETDLQRVRRRVARKRKTKKSK